MSWRYLDLVDYLEIAEAILEIPAAQLARLERLGLAESALNAPTAGFGEVEAYPDFATKAAVLGWYLVKNRPLPDGNKRAGSVAVIEFTKRNGRVWHRVDGDPAEADAMIRGVADGNVNRDQLEAWIMKRTEERR